MLKHIYTDGNSYNNSSLYLKKFDFSPKIISSDIYILTLVLNWHISKLAMIYPRLLFNLDKISVKKLVPTMNI